jgi:hypothetical protein
MASLMELVTSRLPPEVMQKLAGLAGLSAPQAQGALAAIIPPQVYDLGALDTTEAGATRLLRVLKAQPGSVSCAHVLPTVVGVLGREVRERGLTAAGLGTMLRGEREEVRRRSRPCSRRCAAPT